MTSHSTRNSTVQQLLPSYKMGTPEQHITGPLCERNPDWTMDSPHKGLVMRKWSNHGAGLQSDMNSSDLVPNAYKKMKNYVYAFSTFIFIITFLRKAHFTKLKVTHKLQNKR